MPPTYKRKVRFKSLQWQRQNVYFNFNALTYIQYNDNLALTVQQTVQQTPGNGEHDP